MFSRHGQTGVRGDKDIGFATIRPENFVGEHNVMFVGSGERIEISHKAASRMVFAHGALRAAVWLSQQKPGLYKWKTCWAWVKNGLYPVRAFTIIPIPI
ncbi:MAG: hypothetical protein Ct9H300mP14_11970 [Gammaproteobacteria bacterium]|nr:MAG: hypothetical protein Ct9H300mP14_11970 [Gammaproteobacteria bacterium]